MEGQHEVTMLEALAKEPDLSQPTLPPISLITAQNHLSDLIYALERLSVDTPPNSGRADLIISAVADQLEVLKKTLQQYAQAMQMQTELTDWLKKWFHWFFRKPCTLCSYIYIVHSL